MKYLLDTCVISEVIKPSPNEQVVKWIADRDKETLFLSVLTIGELHKGINKLPESKKKTDIQLWMKYDLYKRFGKRILQQSGFFTMISFNASVGLNRIFI